MKNAATIQTWAGLGLVITWAVLLGGCGVTFKVEHVPNADLLQTAKEKPGVYYALPLTEFKIEIPVVVSSKSGGALAGFQECLLQCATDQAAICEKSAEKTNEADPLSAKIESLSAPDPAQLYRVEGASVNPFMTFKHDFKLKSGVLGSATLSGTNETLPVLASIATSVLPLLTPGPLPLIALANAAPGAQPGNRPSGASGGNGRNDKSPIDAHTEACSRVLLGNQGRLFEGLEGLNHSEAVARWLGRPTLKSLRCPEVSCIHETLIALQQQALVELDAADKRIKDAKPETPAPLATLQLSRAQARSQALAARADALRKDLGFETVTKTMTLVAQTSVPVRPVPGITTSWPKLEWRWQLPADLSPADAQPALKAAKTRLESVAVEISPLTVGHHAVLSRNEALKQAGGGYRYRLPAGGRVLVKDGAVLLADDTRPVGQYGVVAALPSQFTGLEAGLSFTLDSDGTLIDVSMGQKAQSAAPLQTASTALQKRQELGDGAALKGAQSENNLLAEQIKADKQRRCQAALATLATDQPWPDICK